MEDNSTNQPAPAVQPNTKKLQSAFSLLKPSMRAIMRNIGAYLALVFFPFLLAMGLGIVTGLSSAGINSNNTGASSSPVFGGAALITLFAVAAVFIIIAPAVVYLSIHSNRGESVGAADAFKSGIKHVLPYIGFSIIFGFLLVVGLILLILPGLIVLRRYILAPYYLIDQDMSIGDAMKKSAEVSKQYSGAIWGLIGVNILIALLSLIPILGQIASSILSILYGFAPAVRYQEILDATGSGITQSAAPVPVQSPAPNQV